MKKKVALIFGGRSIEKDISIITAVQAYPHFDKRLFDVTPVYMFDGDFYMGNMSALSAFTPFNPTAHTKIFLYGGCFFSMKKSKMIKSFKPDVAVICCHGGEGENGVLQALLEYNCIPYTSPGVLQSSVCMDKAVSKELFENMLLNIIQNMVVYRDEFLSDKGKTVFHLESFLTYPLIIKPARLGSSIGIGVANNADELLEGLNVASEFDDKIIVEQKLVDFYEVNCAAFRDGDNVIISETEQPVSSHNFLTFDDKYSTGKMSGGGRIMPASVGQLLNSVVKANTERIYRELDLNGVVRIDYLVDKTRNKVYVNEINTVPGSLAYYLFEPLGLKYEDILEKVINTSIARAENLSFKKNTFDTGVLSSFKGGGKTGAKV